MRIKDRRRELGLTRDELRDRALISDDMAEKVDRDYVPAQRLVRKTIADVLESTPEALWPQC
jgi:lambda repressor-like predicted transcriptional regulator